MEREKLGREALRFPCSQCGGLVQLEARCTDCGDLPAIKGTECWTEWRCCFSGEEASDWGTRNTAEEIALITGREHDVVYEQRTVWATAPVKVEDNNQ